MRSKIKYINRANKNNIYFFIDDSGTIMNEKQQQNLKQEFKRKKGCLSNDLKAFSVTAVCLSRSQIQKGQRLSKSLKKSFNIDVNAPFHRNKMKFNRTSGAFKNITNENLFTITKNLNKFIKKENITFASAGLNNYSEIYNGNYYKRKSVAKNMYYSLMESINKIMSVKYPNQKAIIVFEGENPRSDFSRFNFSEEALKNNPLNKVRTIRFMKKTNKNNNPNFGIELVDYVNGSMFSMFGLADFNIHFKNNMDIKNIDKLNYLSYVNR